jgi:hypothetical protein
MSSTHLSRVLSPVTSILTPSALAFRTSVLLELGLVGVAGVGVIDAFRTVATCVRLSVRCDDTETGK